jgi:hypothetical protein
MCTQTRAESVGDVLDLGLHQVKNDNGPCLLLYMPACVPASVSLLCLPRCPVVQTVSMCGQP